MKKKLFLAGILFVLVTNSLFAQDEIEEYIFPPELVMKHQKALALSSDQKNAIKQEVGEAQKKFTDLQWDMQDEMQTFLSLIEMEKVDEPKAVAQLEKVMKIESQIKRTHLTLAIRIKNLLSSDQQAKLQDLKKKSQ